MHNLFFKNFIIGKDAPLALIAGPCVLEEESEALFIATELKRICSGKPINLIFKSSYDKANRTSISSYRGPGLEKGLQILDKIKKETGLPILTDVHTPDEAKAAAEVCDIIQIPAFLCRQTDLVVAAAKTKAVINVKKGQFMAPWDMKHVIAKIVESGSQRILLTDRGVTFGYNNLVSDFRSIPIMQEMGYPVCFDATHSVQLPGANDGVSGGQRQFIPLLARSAVAAGANALYMEVHPEPHRALSDAASMLYLKDLPQLLDVLLAIYQATQKSY